MNTAQILLLIASGAGAFYAASDWSRGHGASATDPDDGIVAAAPRRPGSAPMPTPARIDGADWTQAARAREIPGGDANAFGPLRWLPPPPPPPPPVAVVAPPPPPPAPPKAPPLPFTFVGMVERGSVRPEAYLAKGDALLVVGAGDEIENKTYRVDTLSPTGVVLTYLPLGLQQTVNAPGTKP